jgi:hypothetical protein
MLLRYLYSSVACLCFSGCAPVHSRGLSYMSPHTQTDFTRLLTPPGLQLVALRRNRAQLSLYDLANSGYLDESGLENFVYDQMGSMPQLAELEEHFYPFYVCTAIRHFFFFLDPSRRGKVSIQDLLLSQSLADFLEMRETSVTEDRLERNWSVHQHIHTPNTHTATQTPSVTAT